MLWFQAIDSKRLSVLVLLDLSSAFDTVDHRILLNILQDRFGVRGYVHRWFKFYLTGRTQVFCTTSGRSDVVNLDCSVPQGSIVGPQQFLLIQKICRKPSRDISMDITSTLMIHSYKRAPASLNRSHVFADSRDVSCRSENGAPVGVFSSMPT